MNINLENSSLVVISCWCSGCRMSWTMATLCSSAYGIVTSGICNKEEKLTSYLTCNQVLSSPSGIFATMDINSSIMHNIKTWSAKISISFIGTAISTQDYGLSNPHMIIHQFTYQLEQHKPLHQNSSCYRLAPRAILLLTDYLNMVWSQQQRVLHLLTGPHVKIGSCYYSSCFHGPSSCLTMGGGVPIVVIRNRVCT